jgi:hypothetical protein
MSYINHISSVTKGEKMEGKVIYDILINFIVFLFGVLVTWVFNIFRSFLNRRLPIMFWTKGANKLTIVYSTSIKKVYRLSEIDSIKYDFSAVGEASQYLRAFSEISLNSDEDQIAKEGNLLIIGGPMTNRLTQEFADQLNPDFFFYDLNEDIRELCNKNKTTRFFSEFDKNGNIIYDVGWFIRDVNPLNDESVVIIAAGNYGYGTLAAVRFISSVKHLRELKFGRNHHIEGIVGVKIENGRIISSKLITTIIK